MAVPNLITYTIKDAKGKTSTLKLHIYNGFSDPLTYAYQVGLLLEPLIGGQIIAIRFVFNLDMSEGGFKNAPLGISDVEERARFKFVSDKGFPVEFSIPTILESKMVAGSSDIDVTDTDVAAFINAMSELTDSRGDNIVEFVSAKEAFRSRR